MNNNYHYNKELRDLARKLRTQSVSKAEKRIWKELLSKKQTGFRFLRQRPIHNYIVDFFCPELKLIIEIDGNSHLNKSDLDLIRQNELEKLGFTIVRFTENEVNKELPEVRVQLNHIIYSISSFTHLNPPSREEIE